ncbi:MAG: NAD(P)H-dependent oxidoreductase [Brachybacterium sp.]|nr:NAD(P)H-dependent oxidoreductase [Brachybacterium sp.]
MTHAPHTPTDRPRRIVVLSAGLSTPSTTRMLADQLSGATAQQLERTGASAEIRTIELREVAHDITDSLLARFATPRVEEIAQAIAEADAVIAVTPIFNTGPSGLFKSLLDAIDMSVWEDTPLLLGATAGTARHGLALEFTIRPIFTYLRADVVPTAVFAAAGDFGSSPSPEADEDPLATRARRAAGELVAAMGHDHPSGDAATPATTISPSSSPADSATPADSTAPSTHSSDRPSDRSTPSSTPAPRREGDPGKPGFTPMEELLRRR